MYVLEKALTIHMDFEEGLYIHLPFPMVPSLSFLFLPLYFFYNITFYFLFLVELAPPPSPLIAT